MPIALNISLTALANYEHLLYRESQGKPAFGIALGIPAGELWADLDNQKAWRELVDAGLAVESPDSFGRYSQYNYVATEQRTPAP